MIQNDMTGMGFDGRDQLMGDDFGWVPQVWLQDLYVMLRYALARRIVSDSADQIIDAGIIVSATGLDASKVDDLGLYLDGRTKDNSLHDALVNAMAFGMGAEIIVLDDGRELSEPVDETNISDVAGIIPSHRWELTPYAWGSNPMVRTSKGWRVNPFYQEPIVYSYTPWMYGSDTLNRGGDWLTGEQGQLWEAPTWDKIKSGTMIHASRIAHYPGIKLPNLLQRDNGGYADPILRQCRRPILAWEGHVHHATDAGRHLSELVYKGDRLTQVIDTPMSGVTTPEQAQRYLANVVAQQQLMSSYKGVRLLQADESLEYLAKPLSGFDQVTQVVMIANAVASGIPLETLFNVSPPGGIGAAGAGRFIWDNYASSIRRRFSGGVAPARQKFYRYAALAKNGPIAAEVKMQLSLGTLTTETLLERAQRKQAEYTALTEAMQGGWIDAREIRAREKQSKDDFIQLDDKYDADLQRPGGLDLSAFAPKPAGEPAPAAVDEAPPTPEPARVDADEPVRTLLIDAGSLIGWAYGDGTGSKAGIVQRFKTLLESTIKKAGAEIVHICFDQQDPTKLIRRQMFEGYKSNRPPIPALLAEVWSDLKKVASDVGTLHEQEGLEADDLIARVLRAEGGKGKALIVSRDKDMMQLLGPKVAIQRKPGDIVTVESFQDENGFHPSRWVDYSCLVGDKTDGIPGVAGIGHKRALDLLSNHDTLDTMPLDDVQKAAATLAKGLIDLSCEPKAPTRTDSVDIAPDGSLVPGPDYGAGAVLSMHDGAYVWLTNGKPNDLGKWVRLQGEVSPQGAAFMALKSFAEAGGQKPLVEKLSAALTTEQAAAAGEALNQAFADEPQVKTDAVEAPPEAWQGIPVRISHRAGSPRHGIIMPAHYGDLPGVMGADGDAVDMLYGPVPDSRVAYVVKQLKPDGAFDEFKCMLGFAGPREAVAAYMLYAPVVTAYGGMTEVPAGELIDWLKARA